MAGVVIGHAVVTAYRSEYFRAVIRVADVLALYRNALRIGLAAIDEGAAVDAANRLVDRRAAVRRAGAEPRDFDA